VRIGLALGGGFARRIAHAGDLYCVSASLKYDGYVAQKCAE
jgi:hypothetical protein